MTIKIYQLAKLKNSASSYQRIITRCQSDTKKVTDTARKIINDVRKNGDKALQKFTRQFDGASILNFRVAQEEIDWACRQLSKEEVNAFRQAAKNIRIVHQSQLPKRTLAPAYPEKGIKVWREWRPIEAVGMYVPGGKAVYPSTILMTCIPAKIAGCSRIVVVSPPAKDGAINPSILLAAKLAGVTEIYKCGGAQAIAALAYGTQSVPKVLKIFGPGNQYVAAAKSLVYPEVSIDLPAGPSEVLIIADQTANPSFIAADLLADCEHGNDSAGVLLTTSEELAKQTVIEIKKQLKELSTASYAKESLSKHGAIIIADSLDQCVDFANDYAPEHLQLMVRDNSHLLKKVTNAGSVLIGGWTSKSSADYATGANHTLPTACAAKVFPALSVDAFGRWMEVQSCSKQGLQAIRKTVETIATLEGLPAHKNSTTIRFRSNK